MKKVHLCEEPNAASATKRFKKLLPVASPPLLGTMAEAASRVQDVNPPLTSTL